MIHPEGGPTTGIEKKPAKKKKVKVSAPKTPRTRKPGHMSVEQWQIALRREYGAEQNFKMENLGREPIFSDFMITNPVTHGQYKVAIRGEKPGINYCSCPDFSINTLGTCKHIEFVLARLKKRKGGKAALKKGCQTLYSSVSLRYGQDRAVVFKPGMECSSGLKNLADKYFDKDGILRPEGFSRFDDFIKEAGETGDDLRCYEDAIRYVAQVRDQQRLKEKVDHAFPKGRESGGLARLINARLYDYQRAGAIFAARAGRAVIADDMGLGKTVQAIAACEILSKVAGIERVLIVCPTSLKNQWKDEIKKFCGREAVVLEGLLASRERLYAADSFFKITNYDVIHRDLELIRKWQPDLIILDEAQRIKNWKTRTAQSVKRLDSQYALVLTGTPLENRLEELHSIVEFVDRFHLGPRFRFLHEHQITDEHGMVTGYKKLSRIGETLSSILIRRKKDEVLKELPERLEKRFFVDMTPQQRKHHEENYDTVCRIVSKWRRFHFLSDTDQRILMIALQNMRMSCNSTYLLDQATDFGNKADELMLLLEDVFTDAEAKAVIFSQWLGTHELIIRRLDGRPWNHVFFHGGVPGPRRKDLIRRFKDEPDCRLFLSTDAGGVGLNLQNASVVINMDLPWNPAVLEQRIGRVHRLGQHRPVRVVNFVSNATIEHSMLSLLSFKKSLFAGVLEGGQDEVFLGGSRLKRFMESVAQVTDAIPQTPPPSEPMGAGAQLAREEPGEKEIEEAVTVEMTSGGKALGEKALEQNIWTDVAQAGMTFLNSLSAAMRTGGEKERREESPAAGQPMDNILSSLIAQDSAGRQYLKLPVPGPETLRKVADIIYQITGGK